MSFAACPLLLAISICSSLVSAGMMPCCSSCALSSAEYEKFARADSSAAVRLLSAARGAWLLLTGLLLGVLAGQPVQPPLLLLLSLGWLSTESSMAHTAGANLLSASKLHMRATDQEMGAADVAGMCQQ
jgi:hypothetical protein